MSMSCVSLQHAVSRGIFLPLLGGVVIEVNVGDNPQ